MPPGRSPDNQILDIAVVIASSRIEWVIRTGGVGLIRTFCRCRRTISAAIATTRGLGRKIRAEGEEKNSQESRQTEFHRYVFVGVGLEIGV
jgi:hypothetical protein